MAANGVWRLGILAAALLVGGPAMAQKAMASDTPFTLQVDPSRYYPDRAQRLEVGGWARLRCVARADATLGDCIVVGEGPGNFGFGQALLMLSRSMRVRPEVLATAVGQPGYYKVTFQVPGVSRGIGQDPVKSPKRKLVEAARPAGADGVGMATVSCLAPLAATSPLTDCVALREGPAGQGFGGAAVGLAQSSYGAMLEPTPAKVEIWFGARMLQDKDARGLIPVFGGDGTNLVVGPAASAEAFARLPQDPLKMTCGWTTDGELRDCVADPAATVPAETVSVVQALAPNLRLVRAVTFNINWGQ